MGRWTEGSVPTAVCDLADKEALLCGCPAGLRQKGRLGIGVEPAGRAGKGQGNLASYFGVTPALQGWRPQGRELGTGEAQAALCLRAQSGDPGSLAA